MFLSGLESREHEREEKSIVWNTHLKFGVSVRHCVDIHTHNIATFVHLPLCVKDDIICVQDFFLSHLYLALHKGIHTSKV